MKAIITLNYFMLQLETINQIKSLRNTYRVTVDWGSGLENVMTSHFNKLFTSSNTEWSNVIHCVQKKVINEHKISLLSVLQRWR